MKKFSLRIFLISTVIVGIFVFGSFLAAFSEVGGKQEPGLLISWFAKTVYVFGFPLITLFSRLGIEPGYPIFFASLVFNTLIYGLLTERIIAMIRKRTRVKPIRTAK